MKASENFDPKQANRTIGKIRAFIAPIIEDNSDTSSGEPFIHFRKCYDFLSVGCGDIYSTFNLGGFCNTVFDRGEDYPRTRIDDPLSKEEAGNLYNALLSIAPEDDPSEYHSKYHAHVPLFQSLLSEVCFK